MEPPEFDSEELREQWEDQVTKRETEAAAADELLLKWTGGVDADAVDKPPVTAPAVGSTVILHNVFDPRQEFNPYLPEVAGQRSLEAIEQDLRWECSKCGVLKDVEILSRGSARCIFLTNQAAMKCVDLMHGRFFCGRQLVADYVADIKQLSGLSKAVLVSNVFAPRPPPPGQQPADADLQFAEELRMEFAPQCARYGPLDSLEVLLHLGAVDVVFKSTVSASDCLNALHGRWFDERELQASFNKQHVDSDHHGSFLKDSAGRFVHPDAGMHATRNEGEGGGGDGSGTATPVAAGADSSEGASSFATKYETKVVAVRASGVHIYDASSKAAGRPSSGHGGGPAGARDADALASALNFIPDDGDLGGKKRAAARVPRAAAPGPNSSQPPAPALAKASPPDVPAPAAPVPTTPALAPPAPASMADILNLKFYGSDSSDTAPPPSTPP